MKLIRRNPIMRTDSYKFTHWDMLPPGTERVYSYLEARVGGEHDHTCFFGAQYYGLEYLTEPVTWDDINDARALAGWHIPKARFNEDWKIIVGDHGGKFPLRICAVPEGTVVPTGNVLMTIENTDPRLPWLTNYVESILMKTWYTTEVATRSWHVKRDVIRALLDSGCDLSAADYMLHDFGYRGTSSEESAAIGGCAHLVNFRGTDTIEAMRVAMAYYGALPGVASSVVATEHSVMTALGRPGEVSQALHVIQSHPNQIVSIVADSYDYYAFVDAMIDNYELVERNHVKLVIRPDSVTTEHKSPAALVAWTLNRIKERLSSTQTPTGHHLIPYGVLWGDGLGPKSIHDVLFNGCVGNGFAASNMVFGMGGGLLQKVNRDTDRFVIKCAAQFRDGQWIPVSKTPLQASKVSKAGRLKLLRQSDREYVTLASTGADDIGVLEPIYENGLMLRGHLFADIRVRANDAALRHAQE